MTSGSHGGFPCGSFSMVRYKPGGPPPVRSLAHMYGLPTNSPAQQAEADRGTLLACRALQVWGETIQSQRLRQVPDLATLENPPGSDSKAEGPAWELPEFRKVMDEMKMVVARFNTCAYQKKERVRWFKPAMFAGLMSGLETLKKTCECPAGFQHEQLLGKKKTSAAAKYPHDLAMEYAGLVVRIFKATMNLEWWRYMEKTKKQEVNQLQKSWVSSKTRSTSGPAMSQDQLSELRNMKRAWNVLGDEKDKLPESTRASKKARREDENDAYLGGMRNPLKAVKRLRVLAEAGQDVLRLWRNFVVDFPKAMEIAATYGSERCEIDQETLKEWNMRFFKLIKVERPTVVLKSKVMFESPLKAEVWKAWQLFSRDPEDMIHSWVVRGVPLGMSEEVPLSNGIFPPVFETKDSPDVAPGLEAQLGTINYKSMYDDVGPAQEELDRLVSKGFAVIMEKEEAVKEFQTGTMSRLALITKVKENYTKYRIIIDLLR